MTFQSFYNRRAYLVGGLVAAILLPVIIMFIWSSTQSRSSGNLGSPKKSGATISNSAISPTFSTRIVPVASRTETRVTPTVRVPGSKYLAKPSGRGVAKSLRFHQGWWGRFPLKVEKAAFCVARHESWGKMWKGQNPVSTASGFAQWINSTWRVNAKRAGVKVTSRARYATPKDQAKVFAWMWLNGGKSAWNGTHCPGTGK